MYEIELKSVYLTWLHLKYTIMFMDRFKSTFLHKYGICLNKYPESVQICHLLYKSVQNMTFN